MPRLIDFDDGPTYVWQRFNGLPADVRRAVLKARQADEGAAAGGVCGHVVRLVDVSPDGEPRDGSPFVLSVTVDRLSVLCGV